MTKKIIILIILTIIGYFLYRHFSKPTFEGPQAEIKEALWEWNKATSDENKLLSAKNVIYIVYASQAKSIFNKEKLILDPEDEVSFKNVQEFNAQLKDEVSNFESSLTASEINLITEKNPESIFKKVGRYSSSWFIHETCTELDYQKLLNTYNSEEIFERASLVSMITLSHETMHVNSYVRKILIILEEKQLAHTELLKAYYSNLINSQNDSSKLAESLEKYYKQIEGTGLKRDEILNYTTTMVLKAPNCLTAANPTFINMAKKHLGEDRAVKILEFIKQELAAGKPLPDSIYDIQGSLGFVFDGNSPDFFFKKTSPSRLELLSAGEDFEKNTADDINFGSVGE